MYVRSDATANRTLYLANAGTGVMSLNVDGSITVAGSITVGGTVDGIEVSSLSAAYLAHAADTGIHHARSHALDSASDHTGTLPWDSVNKTGSDLADLAVRKYTDLTARSHLLANNLGLGPDHTISGASSGWVLRATTGTAAAMAQLQHADLGGVTADQHHAKVHVLATQAALGADHTISGATAGHVLRASSATAANFQALSHADLTGVTADQHHAQAHNIAGSDHTASGTSVYQVLGIPSTINVIGWMTPSATPGAHTLVKTDTDSRVTFINLTVTNTIAANGGIDLGVNSLIEDVGANRLNVAGSRPVHFAQTIQAANWNITTGGYATLTTLDLGATSFNEDATYLNVTGAKEVNFGQAIRGGDDWRMSPAGGLAATSATISGNVNVTNGGDLSVAGSGAYAGVQVLVVDSSGGNVGVNCTPDPQFALDVAGPLRASILYGPHGLILKDVLLLAHYDGRQPYTTNFSGEPNGHMGQTATTTGGVIFRPGRFDKAIQVAPAATNLLLNPSFETNLTNWTATGTGTGGAATRTDARSYAGNISVRLTAADGGNYLIRSNQINLEAGASVTVQCRLWRSANIAAQLQIRDVTNGSTRVTASPVQIDEWELLTTVWTNTTGGTVTVEMRVSNTHADGTAFVWVDACQMELSTYATPYCDGTLGGYSSTGAWLNEGVVGSGHAWTGAAHASTSTRAAAMLSYPTTGNIDQRKWTIMAWVCLAGLTSFNHEILRITGTTAGYIILRLDSLGRPQAWSGTAAITATSVLTPGVWTHIAATYDGTTLRIYYNGLEVASGISSGFDGMPASMFVGRSSAANQYLNGWIDDLVILSQAETAAKIRAVVESDAPVAAEVSRYVFRATPKGLVWGDDEGLWVRDAAGNDTFGIYGGEAATKSWGGLSLGVGDVLIGRGSDYMHWDSNLGTMNFSGDGAGLTSINGGNIQTGTITASKLSVTAGGENLLANSGFEIDTNVDGLSDSWSVYNNSAVAQPITSTRVTGRLAGSFAQRVAWTVANTSTKGLSAAQLGGRKAGVWYCVSWWVKTNTSTPVGLEIRHNTQPDAGNEWILQPTPVNNVWQRYAKRMKWSADNNDAWYFSVINGASVTGTVDFDDVMVHEGDTLQSYMPRTSEILPGTITAVHLNVANLSAIAANMGTINAGSIVLEDVGPANKLWFNEANDGGIAIGGLTKASAPFRVEKTGKLWATGAEVSGKFSAGPVVIDEDGIDVTGTANYTSVNSYSFSYNGVIAAGLFARKGYTTDVSLGSNTIDYLNVVQEDTGSTINLIALADGSSVTSTVFLQAKNKRIGTEVASITLSSDDFQYPGGYISTSAVLTRMQGDISFHGGYVYMDSPLRLASGDVRSSENIAFRNRAASAYVDIAAKHVSASGGFWTMDGGIRSNNTIVALTMLGAYQNFIAQSVMSTSGYFTSNNAIIFTNEAASLYQSITAASMVNVDGIIYSTQAIRLLNGGSAQHLRTASVLASSDYNHNTRVPANGIYSLGGIAIATPETITSGYVLDVNGAVRFRGSIALNAHVNLSPISEPATSGVTGIFWMGLDNKLYFKKPSGTPILVAG